MKKRATKTWVAIATDGKFEIIGKPSLKELQSRVGGYLERVKAKHGRLWVDEDGRSKNLPLNRMASELADQRIVGNVVYEGRLP